MQAFPLLFHFVGFEDPMAELLIPYRPNVDRHRGYSYVLRMRCSEVPRMNRLSMIRPADVLERLDLFCNENEVMV